MPTKCIVHKGFGSFRAVLPASILGGNLIGMKPAIPYYAYTLPSGVGFIVHSDK